MQLASSVPPLVPTEVAGRHFDTYIWISQLKMLGEVQQCGTRANARNSLRYMYPIRFSLTVAGSQ